MKRKILIIIPLLFLIFIPDKTFALTSYGGVLQDEADTVCYGNNHGVLRLNGEIGDVLYWEYSYSGSSPWMTISNTTDSLEYNNLTQTTYFRAIVKYADTEQDTSTIAVVYVSMPSDAGTLSEDMEVCETGNEGTLQLTGYTADKFFWQFSSDSGSTWVDLSNNQPSYTFQNLSETNLFRVYVTNGVCPADTSNIVTVKVDKQSLPGNIYGSDSLCYGANSGEVWVNGYRGSILRWEMSSTGYAPWSAINYENDTLGYTNLGSTVYYRAVIKNGVCSEVVSDSAVLVVSPQSEGGIVSGSDEVCSEANSGTLVLSDYTGAIQNWQYSTDFGTTWQDTSNINHTMNYSGLTQTTMFRAVIKSGACSIAYSEPATITVHPLPQPSFTNDTVCDGESVIFHNNTTIPYGSVVSYSWDFGNGDGNNAVNPVYTYPAPGTYTVKLTAVSDKGCVDSTFGIARVNPAPVVAYSFNNVCYGDTVNFSNNSFSVTGNSLVFSWDFGDTTQDTVTSPAHFYSSYGDYQVKLVATESASGCKDSLISTVSIYPRAVPDFSAESVCDGNPVTFINHTTVPEGAVNYYWTFGDGHYDNVANPEYQYQHSGTYTVMLYATTDHGCTDTASRVVHVNPVPDAGFEVNDICYTDTVVFQNTSSIDSGSIYFVWDFGNGDTSHSTNPSYYYQAPGTYTVSLEVVSDSGCSAQVTKNINVYPLPNVLFDVDDVCAYDSAVFINNTTVQSGELEYHWLFGDGNESIVKNPVHLYDTAGTYNVKLIAISGGMCSDSAEKTLTVFPVPVPDFEASQTCDGFPTFFTNQTTISSGFLQSILWDFGDGENSIQSNPEHQYLNPGTYNVRLQVYSNNGCVADTVKPVKVDYTPVANFTANNVCDGTPVDLNNISTIDEGALTYMWDFGDGDSSILPEPNHLYAGPGIYRIVLHAYSGYGCEDSLVRYVQVYQLPEVYAGEDTSISKGQSVQLNASGGSLYYWTPSASLSNPSVPNPVATPVSTTDYIVQAEDLNGCVNYDTVRVYVIDDYKIQPSNVITPNGDGVNDTWQIENIENYGNSTVRIYDRWGNEVYYKKGYDNSWDGTNMNGDLLPDGTYYYIITFDNSSVVYKGSISILRND